MNKLGSLNKYQEKPSLLLRKPELEYKLSVSPGTFVNEYPSSLTQIKKVEISTIPKRNDYKSIEKEKIKSLNYEVNLKNSPKNQKKIGKIN